MEQITLARFPPPGATLEELAVLVAERVAVGVPVETACRWAKLNKSTYYRLRNEMAGGTNPTGQPDERQDAPPASVGHCTEFFQPSIVPAIEEAVDRVVRAALADMVGREPNASGADGITAPTQPMKNKKKGGDLGR
jgi:hypothetical protein